MHDAVRVGQIEPDRRLMQIKRNVGRPEPAATTLELGAQVHALQQLHHNEEDAQRTVRSTVHHLHDVIALE